VRVEIKVFAEIKEPYAVIYTNAITGEVMKIRSILEIQEPIVTVADGERIIVLTPEETYMIRTENEDVVVYNKDRRYISNKRLYEMEALLGNGFLRISKSTIINLRMIDYVEPAFNGMMMILLKNGSKDFISRKYLPQLKKYLGI
jgi:DNA-binding LytR/AlgR family response regulator